MSDPVPVSTEGDAAGAATGGPPRRRAPPPLRPVPAGYVGGCLPLGVMTTNKDLFTFRQRIMHCATRVLVTAPGRPLAIDTAGWSKMARTMFEFENQGRYATYLDELPVNVLVDVIRDFSKPLLVIGGRTLSWQYCYDDCRAASAALLPGATFIDVGTAEYFDAWRVAFEMLVARLAGPGRRLFLLLPQPALVWEDGGVLRPFDGPLNRIDGRLVALVGRANHWLASRFATHPGVWLVAPPAPVVTTADPARRWVYHYDERTLRFLGLQIHPSCLP